MDSFKSIVDHLKDKSAVTENNKKKLQFLRNDRKLGDFVLKKEIERPNKKVVKEEEKSIDLGMGTEDEIPFSVVTDEQIKQKCGDMN